MMAKKKILKREKLARGAIFFFWKSGLAMIDGKFRTGAW
jgi:hypothetical protein